jgi:hypothetical protein
MRSSYKLAGFVTRLALYEAEERGQEGCVAGGVMQDLAKRRRMRRMRSRQGVRASERSYNLAQAAIMVFVFCLTIRQTSEATLTNFPIKWGG